MPDYSHASLMLKADFIIAHPRNYRVQDCLVSHQLGVIMSKQTSYIAGTDEESLIG